MAVNIKAVKSEILANTTGEAPAAAIVKADDMMDMMLTEYFNPASQMPKDYALTALTAGASINCSGAEISEKQVKAILDKYKP